MRTSAFPLGLASALSLLCLSCGSSHAPSASLDHGNDGDWSPGTDSSPPGSGSNGGGGTGNGSDGSTNNNGTPDDPGDDLATDDEPGLTVLTSGDEPLIGAFVTESGVAVVTEGSVRLLDRAGAELATKRAARPIRAAALGDGILAIADGAKLTSLDVGTLAVIATTNLIEACEDGVIVSGARFVCGPQNDWDRVFYTYDLLTGDFLASSEKYTYNGIPMRVVPGLDAFVTVTDSSSPSDFHLYRVGEDNSAKYIGESPYHGDFGVTNVYAFDNEPATSLITHGGLILDFSGDGCNAAMNSFDSGCFVKSGALGVLTGAQAFVAMDNDRGTLYALVDPSPSYWSSEVRTHGLILQSIDVEARTVLTQATYVMPSGRPVSIEYDPTSNDVLFAFRKPGEDFYDSPYPGYVVGFFELGRSR